MGSRYPETPPLLEQLLGSACEMGDQKQRFCHSAFSRDLSILSDQGEKRYLCQHPCSLSSVVSLLAGETDRHRAQKHKCVTLLPNVVSFWFWGFVVEEFEGLAHLG